MAFDEVAYRRWRAAEAEALATAREPFADRLRELEGRAGSLNEQLAIAEKIRAAMIAWHAANPDPTPADPLGDEMARQAREWAKRKNLAERKAALEAARETAWREGRAEGIATVFQVAHQLRPETPGQAPVGPGAEPAPNAGASEDGSITAVAQKFEGGRAVILRKLGWGRSNVGKFEELRATKAIEIVREEKRPGRGRAKETTVYIVRVVDSFVAYKDHQKK